MNDIITQLCDIYYKYEWWHKDIMAEPVANRYHKFLLEQGNIQVYEELGVVLGYYEVWFITRQQLNNIILGKRFSAEDENVTDGNIAYLANLFIDKSFRDGKVMKELLHRFREHTKHCDIIIGEETAHRKRLRVFNNRRNEWVKKSLVLPQI